MLTDRLHQNKAWSVHTPCTGMEGALCGSPDRQPWPRSRGSPAPLPAWAGTPARRPPLTVLPCPVPERARHAHSMLQQSHETSDRKLCKIVPEPSAKVCRVMINRSCGASVKPMSRLTNLSIMPYLISSPITRRHAPTLVTPASTAAVVAGPARRTVSNNYQTPEQ